MPRVHLSALPPELTFPPQVATKIQFDGSRRELDFTGFMTKSEYDRLVGLSHDPSYQRAIASLFAGELDGGSSKVRKLGYVFGAGTVLCVLLAAFVWWSVLQVTPAQSVDANLTSSGTMHATIAR